MKYSTVLLALVLLLVACGCHDAEFNKKIPGAWKQELKSYTNALTIYPDNSFTFSRFTTNADTTFTNAGTWLILGGRITLTSTRQVGTHPLALGELLKVQIIHLDDHVWLFKTDEGITNRFTR